MSDLLERLEARATPVGPAIFHTLAYNFPLAWYRRPDGDIVQLQSDPNNRAMYEDLGFVLLRPAEAREWEDDVRPGVILEQKHRARLITAIRKIQSLAPQYLLSDDDQLEFPTLPIDELQKVFDDACETTGLKPRLGRIPPEKETKPADQHLQGVETHAGGELESKLQRGQGYDPMKEARRR